jgi:hypothetical protein
MAGKALHCQYRFQVHISPHIVKFINQHSQTSASESLGQCPPVQHNKCIVLLVRSSSCEWAATLTEGCSLQV